MVVTKLVTVVSLGLIEKSLRVRLPPTIGININIKYSNILTINIKLYNYFIFFLERKKFIIYNTVTVTANIK